MQLKDVLYTVNEVREKVSKLDLQKQYEEALIVQSLSQKEIDSLKKLRGYAQAQLQLEALMALVEEFINSIKSDYKTLTETVLPELMDELGVPSLSISENHELTISEKTTASIPKPKINDACDYLEEHGSGSLIKRELTSRFGREDNELVKKAIEALEELGIQAEESRSVHHSTLSAWVREQLEEGEEIPFDLFGVFRRRASTIKEKSRS